LRGQENRKRVERLTFLSSGRVKIIIYKAGTKTVSKYKNNIHGTEKPIDVQKENST